jgi:hypothetical protein
MNTQTLYQKIQDARVELQTLNLKKSGRNSYSNFTYYELGDFLPALNTLMAKKGIMTVFSIVTTKRGEKAVLDIIDTAIPSEKVTFTMPTAEVEIGRKKDGTGGAEPIQNLGGKSTYMRRYMLMIAFEIVESDYVDRNPVLLEVPESDIQRIQATKTLEELQEVYQELNVALGKSYTRSLVKHCSDRKKTISPKAK